MDAFVFILYECDNHEDQPIGRDTSIVWGEQTRCVDELLQYENERLQHIIGSQVFLNQSNRLQSVVVAVSVSYIYLLLVVFLSAVHLYNRDCGCFNKFGTVNLLFHIEEELMDRFEEVEGVN